ncbi:MAG: DUF1232 domain-containing protein [Halanaerobiales bacterium]|nr:DUF1232 domain-containing protein [Halanaerobiales bacterium]
MNKEERFYLKLRNKIKNSSEKISKNKNIPEYLLLAPDIFYLLIKLIQDQTVSDFKKIKLGIVIAYFITPIDLLPELFVGLTGYIDDLALAAYLFDDIINDLDNDLIEKYWPGEQKFLDLIKEILSKSNNFLDKKIVDKAKKIISKI